MTAVALIEGDRTLPAGFAHPHASEEARSIAEAGLILRVQVGSGVHEPQLSYLRAVRLGEVDLAEVVTAVDVAERQLEALRDGTDLPAEPDREWVDSWLHRSHLSYWAATGA